MFFVTFDTKDFSVAYARQVVERIIHFDDKHNILTAEQRQGCLQILRPTLSNNEAEVKKLCDHLVDTLVVKDDKGVMRRFYRDNDAGLVYFGDEEGWKTAQKLHRHPDLDPTHLHQD